LIQGMATKDLTTLDLSLIFETVNFNKQRYNMFIHE